MKNIVSKLALAAVLAAGLAAPAFADVDAVASINKDKNVSVFERISIDKDVLLDLTVDLDLDRAAEASAVANIRTANNRVDRTPDLESLLGGFPNGFLIRAASIDGEGGSVNENSGVTGVNQDVGAMTNQGNLWSLALAQENATDPSLFTDAQAEVEQDSTFNAVVFQGDGEGPGLQNVLFASLITSSINGNQGLTGVNQNTGNMNNQTNAVAVAAGVELEADDVSVSGASVALAEAALGQEASNNVIFETTPDQVVEGDEDEVTVRGTTKTSAMINSINSNIGITQANQSSGNVGNQGNVVAAGAAVLGL